MGRQQFSVEGTQVNRADPRTYGGGAGVETLHDNAAPDWKPTGPDELQRYRSMGQAAAQRQAYQANFGKALGDEAQGWQAHGNQNEAANGLRMAAMGAAPSQAGILGNQAAGQSLQAQMQAGAGGRGMGQAAAQMQAAQGIQGQQLGAMGQYAGMRGGEMQHAQQSYGQAGGAMRAGDYAQQGMAQQRAELVGQSELAQKQLNQQAQMGFEQMGINTQQAESDGAIRMAAMQNDANADADASHDARNARNMKLATGAMSAIGTFGTSVSDERTKDQVVPLSTSAFGQKLMRGGEGDSRPDAGDGSTGASIPYANPGDLMPELADSGLRARISEDGKAGWAQDPIAAQSTRNAGASLSGPTPKYSTAAPPAAPKPSSMGQAAAKKQRKPTDAELQRMADEMLGTQAAQHEASLAQGPSTHDRDMGAALEQGLKPFQYEYKPGFTEAEGQQPGEKNIGPMAQNMASNPVTGSAVKQDPNTGLLMIDMPKATKLNSAGIGYLAAKQRELEERMNAKGGR